MLEGVADQTHYVAARAGVLGFSRSLAQVVGEHGITVNVVTPGLTVTPKVEAKSHARYATHKLKRAIPRERTRAPIWSETFSSLHRPAPISYPVKPSMSMAESICFE
jgi:NAD(P)-dependent dehydrogenase (short-subunit alcohol dehydrogenase family)